MPTIRIRKASESSLYESPAGVADGKNLHVFVFDTVKDAASQPVEIALSALSIEDAIRQNACSLIPHEPALRAGPHSLLPRPR